MIFGLRYPIFQAPTGTVASTELCEAVTRAGGMGAMGCTGMEPGLAYRSVLTVFDHLLMEPSGLPAALYQVNFVLTFEPVALDAVLDLPIPVITFSWGDPSPYIKKVRKNKSMIGIQIGSVEGARKALALEPDFLICQGIEAGGHVQSTTPLRELLQRVVDVARDTPVVAAGGISTGKHIAEVLDLGASAAMLGSRFVATTESEAHPVYKQQLVEGSATSMTTCFDVGWPQAQHRVLRNSTLEMWEAAGCPPSGQRPGEGDIVAHRKDGEIVVRYQDLAPKPDMTGRIEEMCLYAGQGVGEIEDIPTAGALLERLWAECEAYQNGSGRHHP